MPKELKYPRKGLINIQNSNVNEYFQWCLLRYINPANHHPVTITKSDKYFAKTTLFWRHSLVISCLFGQNKRIHKIKQKYSISINVFRYEDKAKHPIYVSKKISQDKNMLIYYLGDENKRHYVFIKDFNMFMYDGFVVYKLSVQNKF